MYAIFKYHNINTLSTWIKILHQYPPEWSQRSQAVHHHSIFQSTCFDDNRGGGCDTSSPVEEVIRGGVGTGGY